MRKKYVDIIKAFGIFLVILGHANHANAPLKTWIYSFHMPLFFFASGLVMRQYPIAAFAKKSFHRLIVPYFLWACIYASFSLENLLVITYGSYSMLNRAQSLTSLWFLTALFCGQATVQLVGKNVKNLWIRMTVGVCLTIFGMVLPKLSVGYPWNINAAFMAAGFLMLGWVLEEVAAEWLSQRRAVCFLIGVVGTVGTMAAVYGFSNGGYAMMATCSVGNPLVFCVTALSGCMMAYGFSRCIDLRDRMSALVTYIGQNTLVIFAVHKPIISAFEKVFRKVMLPWFLELAITGIGVLIISCALAALINRYLPKFAGKM